jgi:hypothetical protein
VGARVRPAAVEGRDLLVLVPRLYGPLDPLPGAVKVATTATGPSFEAPFERLPGFADAPLAAVRSTDVTHRFRVVDHVSGAPVVGAYVGVGRASGRAPFGAERAASGTTDERGEIELVGVPQDDARVVVMDQGYENHGSELTPTAGGTTEIRLHPIPDVRDVALTIRPLGGEPPTVIWCEVSDEQGRTVHSGVADVEARRGAWSATETLENVPAGQAFLRVYTSPASYDPIGPIRIEPGQDEIEVELADEVPLVQVVLDLPLDANATYCQGARGRRFGQHRGRHSGLSPVTTAPDDGRPVVWVVDAPGYVPTFGTEEHWRRSTYEGRPCVTIAPEMRRGWGSLIRAVSTEVDDGVPFRFREQIPIANVTIVDPATGMTLGVTDETGYAIISAEAPLERIEARYGGVTKSVGLKGMRGATLGF